MCCCCPSRNARRKAFGIQLSTLLLLPLAIGLLYLSTINDAPWFRLVIQRQPRRRSFFGSYSFHTPLAFSVIGAGSSRLLLHNTDSSKLINNSDFSTPISDEFVPSTALFSLENNNSNECLVYTVWHLQTVELSIPPLRIHPRTIQLNDLSGDPLVQTALSLSGFYQSVIDLRSATDLILALGEWAMVPSAFASVFLIIWIFSSAIKKASRRAGPSTDALLLDNEDPYSPSYRTISIDSSSLLQVSHLPFAIIGSLSLISAVCTIIGLIVWSTHSLVDAHRILLGIAHIVGEDAARWLSEHSGFEVDIGLIEYVSAAVLLLLVAIMNLCSDFRLKRPRQHDHHMEYQPPIDVTTPQIGRSNDGTLRERSPVNYRNNQGQIGAVGYRPQQQQQRYENIEGGRRESETTAPTISSNNGIASNTPTSVV